MTFLNFGYFSFYPKTIGKIILFSILSSFSAFAQFPGGVGGRVMNMGKSMGASNANSKTSGKPRIKKDTLSLIFPDSLKSIDSQLETTVETYSSDSTVLDVPNRIYQLFGDAQVTYGDIQLKADYIKLDWNKNEVYAFGTPDSTKKVGTKIKGKPVFIDRGEAYNSDTIRYNFKSKKAIVSNIVTVQGDGFVQGEKVKKDPEDNMYLSHAKYTTCNLAEPHFHISAKKIKLVNKKTLVSGPFNIVVGKVPLPIGLPFGFFPIPKKKEIGTSGFVMGSYGEDPNFRGFYFRDFGYYHAFNEYIGAKVLAQVYTNGSWGAAVQSNYTKKYKYNGNVSLQINSNKAGEILDSKFSHPKDFSITWSHSPQSLRSDRSFSANVNLVSNGFNKNNTSMSNVNQYTKSSMSSAIQTSRNFGKLIRTSVSVRGDQNVITKVFNASANYNLGINQFNPIVPDKKQIGRWYESFRVGLDVTGGYAVNNTVNARSNTFTDYNMAGVYNKPYTSDEQRHIARLSSLVQNPTISTTQRAAYADTLAKLQPTVLTSLTDILNKSQFTTSYSVPIVLPNIKVSKFLNISPSISYRGDMFTKQLQYHFLNPAAGQQASVKLANGKTVTVVSDPNIKSDSIRYAYSKNDQGAMILTETVGANSGGVVAVDTVKGAYFAQNISMGASLNTRVYGTYRFGSNSRIQAIRHTLSPSMGISYQPANSSYATTETIKSGTVKTYDAVAKDTVSTLISTRKNLPRYIGGSTANPSEAMNISFGLSNQLEAKVRSKSDTATNEFNKISILDNFGITGSYNPLAKSRNFQNAFSNVNFSAASNLFKGLVNLNGSAIMDPYKYSKDVLVSTNEAGVRSYNEFKSLGWSKLGASWFSQYNVSASTRLSPKTFNKTEKPKNTNIDPAREAMDKFVRANPMDYVDFNIPWSLNFNYTISYYRQGMQARATALKNITQALTIAGDLSLTPKTKITFNSGWDFRWKAVTLTNISIMRELHCWDMAFTWTPIYGNNIQASNYSFTLKPRSALLADMKLSRRRYNTTNGGF